MKLEMSERERDIYKVTLRGSLVNFILLVFKFVAGVVGRSSAMIADAVHSLSDFVTDVIVVVFVRISGKPQDKGHDYGHGKFETLATAIIGVALFVVGVGLLVNATKSIVGVIRGEVLEAPGVLALVAAAVSVVLKELLYQYTVLEGKRHNSKVVIANAWHHRSDAFSSVGTLVGISGAMFLGENWRVLDPIAAFIVSVFIIKVAIELTKSSIDDLMEKSLPEEVEQRIEEIILSHPEVNSPHHLRTRQIGNNVAIEVHIRMNGELTLREAHDVTRLIEQSLRQEFGEDTHIGIHMEPNK